MRRVRWLLALGVVGLLAMGTSRVAGASGEFAEGSPALQAVVDGAVQSALARFEGAKLRADELAVTVVDLADPERPRRGGYRGDQMIYPASVIKVFYLAAAHRWMEDGRIEDTPELRRAMRDMIVESYNEATHYVIDLLTGTTSGPELPEGDLAVWVEKRNAVTRYFEGMGYTGVVANKKPWCEGPYGRETQAIRAYRPNRNMLTTDATARLMVEIATGRAVSAARSAQMLELMKRDSFGGEKDPDGQAKFSGPALPAGAKLWSKAGWTSETRHDAALIELPGGRRLVVVVFTVNHANEREIIHQVVRFVVEGVVSS